MKHKAIHAVKRGRKKEKKDVNGILSASVHTRLTTASCGRIVWEASQLTIQIFITKKAFMLTDIMFFDLRTSLADQKLMIQ